LAVSMSARWQSDSFLVQASRRSRMFLRTVVISRGLWVVKRCSARAWEI
jgi:hypothetical protein